MEARRTKSGIWIVVSLVVFLVAALVVSTWTGSVVSRVRLAAQNRAYEQAAFAVDSAAGLLANLLTNGEENPVRRAALDAIAEQEADFTLPAPLQSASSEYALTFSVDAMDKTSKDAAEALSEGKITATVSVPESYYRAGNCDVEILIQSTDENDRPLASQIVHFYGSRATDGTISFRARTETGGVG